MALAGMQGSSALQDLRQKQHLLHRNITPMPYLSPVTRYLERCHSLLNADSYMTLHALSTELIGYVYSYLDASSHLDFALPSRL